MKFVETSRPCKHRRDGERCYGLVKKDGAIICVHIRERAGWFRYRVLFPNGTEIDSVNEWKELPKAIAAGMGAWARVDMGKGETWNDNTIPDGRPRIDRTLV